MQNSKSVLSSYQLASLETARMKCSREPHFKADCPAKDVLMQKCKKMGHFQ